MTTRRTFLKTAAAFAMAPMVRLRQEIDAERLMLPFCGREHSRYMLHAPFGVGELTYATDQYAMVRTELANRVEEGHKRLPPVEEAWARYCRPDGAWSYLTPDDIQPTEIWDGGRWSICPECGNRRVSLGDKYPDVDTHEERMRLGLLDYDIDDNTIRDASCPACRGRDFSGASAVRIHGVPFMSWHLRRIVALPNVRVCRSAENGCILFAADGFEGVAMGLRE